MFNPNDFGRAMMAHSTNMKDDAACNAFARVGNKLVNLGQPGHPKTIYDFPKDDIEVITTALSVLNKVTA